VRETSSESGSYEEVLCRLLQDVLGEDASEEAQRGLTVSAPPWVLERISHETGVSVETAAVPPFLVTDTLVVAAVPALEHEGGLGFLAAVNVITGICVDLTACHPEVPPDRWSDLTLALVCGLGSAASVAIEMIGALDVG
jgi:hypothetical protein